FAGNAGFVGGAGGTRRRELGAAQGLQMADDDVNHGRDGGAVRVSGDGVCLRGHGRGRSLLGGSLLRRTRLGGRTSWTERHREVLVALDLSLNEEQLRMAS